MPLENALAELREREPKRPSSLVGDKIPNREIDWIALTALAKCPNERYQSAVALASDLKRLLANQPLHAHPKSLTYSLAKWAKRNRPLVLTSTIISLLILGSILGIRYSLERNREDAWVRRLLEAETLSVPLILAEQPDLSKRMRLALSATARDNPASTSLGLHARLAMVSHDSDYLQPLIDQAINTPPQFIKVFQNQIEIAHLSQEAATHLKTILQNNAESNGKRLRAGAMLVGLKQSIIDWELYSDNFVRWLSTETNHEQWSDLFMPIAAKMVKPLKRRFRSELNTSFSAVYLAKFLARDADALTSLIKTGSPSQFPPLLKALERIPDSIHQLESELMTELPPTADIDRKDYLANGYARIAIALLTLGRTEQVMRHLSSTEDPTIRYHIIHSIANYRVDAKMLFNLILENSEILHSSDPSPIRSLLLALGDYSPNDVEETAWRHLLESLYRNHPDSGIHSITEWLLREWLKIETDQLFLDDQERDRSSWFVNSVDLMMVKIRGPILFKMGSPLSDPGRRIHAYFKKDFEAPHWRAITRNYAIASKTLTFRQFEKMKPDYLKSVIESNLIDQQNGKTLSLDSPVEAVTYADALRFCMWLTEKEGIPNAEQCFYIPEGEENPIPVDDFLEKTGYRLPTDAEWEYACRAGTETIRPWGATEEYVVHYGWMENNAQNHTWPPGTLRPNAWGIFDMFGNVYEWVHGYFVAPPSDTSKIDPIHDTDSIVNKLPDEDPVRAIRSQYFTHQSLDARSSFRYLSHPDYQPLHMSLRLARTIR